MSESLPIEGRLEVVESGEEVVTDDSYLRGDEGDDDDDPKSPAGDRESSLNKWEIFQQTLRLAARDWPVHSVEDIVQVSAVVVVVVAVHVVDHYKLWLLLYMLWMLLLYMS